MTEGRLRGAVVRESDAAAGRRLRAGVRSTAVRLAGGVRAAVPRPTASDVATTVLALATVVAAGSTLVGLELAALATLAGVAAGVVVVPLASRNPAARALGGVLAVPVAVLVATPSTLAWAFAVGVGGFGLVASVALWALVFAGLAATLAPWDRLGEGGVRRASAGTGLVALGVVGVVALRILPDAGVRERAGAAAADLVGMATETLVAPPADRALVTFFGLLVVAAFAAGRPLRTLPIERFAPPDRRDDLADAIDRIGRALSIAIRVGLVGGLASLALPALSPDLEATPATVRTELPAPIGDLAATLVTSTAVRNVLLAVAAVAVALWFAERVRRALRRGFAATVARVFAPAAGGAVVALSISRALADPALNATLEATLATVAPESVVALIASVPAFAVAALVLVLALSSLSSTLFSVAFLRMIRLLPPRALGAALAAAAAFVLAVVLALVGSVEPAIWTAAAAFVVWDVGAYADGLRRELGRDARTIRAELVRVGGAVATGLVVGGGAVALSRWLGRDVAVVDPRLAAVAVAAGVLTTVLAAWSLRG